MHRRCDFEVFARRVERQADFVGDDALAAGLVGQPIEKQWRHEVMMDVDNKFGCGHSLWRSLSGNFVGSNYDRAHVLAREQSRLIGSVGRNTGWNKIGDEQHNHRQKRGMDKEIRGCPCVTDETWGGARRAYPHQRSGKIERIVHAAEQQPLRRIGRWRRPARRCRKQTRYDPGACWKNGRTKCR